MSKKSEEAIADLMARVDAVVTDAFEAGYVAGVKATSVHKNGELLTGTLQTPFDLYRKRIREGQDSYYEDEKRMFLRAQRGVA